MTFWFYKLGGRTEGEKFANENFHPLNPLAEAISPNVLRSFALSAATGSKGSVGDEGTIFSPDVLRSFVPPAKTGSLEQLDDEGVGIHAFGSIVPPFET